MWSKFSNYIRRWPQGLILWSAKKVVLVTRLSEIYLSCYNLFLQFLHYRRRNNRLKTIVSMSSCGALERSSNPCIESILEPCVSKNQKAIFAMWVWLGRKSWKKAEAMESSTHELKVEFVYLILWQRKINSFEITVIIFKVFIKM